MIESEKPSLLDIVTFDTDVKVIEEFFYPNGAVCLLQKGQQTCVLNVNLSFEGINARYSPFKEPSDTIKTYSCFFLELRRGNDNPNFNSIPNITSGIPDFIQIRQAPSEAKSV